MNIKLITAAAVTLGAVFTGALAPRAEATEYQIRLTQPNEPAPAYSCSGGASQYSGPQDGGNYQIRLTQPNVSECQVKIKNGTNSRIYYDFGYQEDQLLYSYDSKQWELPNGQESTIVLFDYNLNQGGIQPRYRTVRAGYKYEFYRYDNYSKLDLREIGQY